MRSKWLRDHRLALRKLSEAAEAVVADLVSRVSEAAGEAPPAEGHRHLGTPPPRARINRPLGGKGAAEAAEAAAREEAARTCLTRPALVSAAPGSDAAKAEHQHLVAAAAEHDAAQSSW